MSRVKYLAADGTETVLVVPASTSIMQAAVSSGVRGIVGECGGQLMCATCHVYVESVAGQLPEQTQDERDMLELAASPVHECSRLSCQLIMDDSIAHARVRLPETQV
ncbi:2Fe-2S iron-sulfur cluster-binding protein [Microbacterium sp. A94]|uniref:2Fe-2S iron-sulfur cluster-binding protein n=1 Tax=Microbacterium sp. A94 TaxID=3450717 RepID=UPI003F421E91